MNKIRILDQEYEIAAPSSPSMAADVLGMAGSWTRQYGAAIGVACPRLARRCKAGEPRAHRYDMQHFGGIVFDALVKAGVDIQQISEAGAASLNLIATALPQEPEVAAEVDFSGATP